MAAWSPLRSIWLAAIGLMFGILAMAAAGHRLAEAQPRPMVLTLVAADGNLWALPDGAAPVLVRADLGRGARVAGLAWHPTRPELLVVRQSWREEDGVQMPFDALYRVDLSSATEEQLYPEVGPQARLLAPRYAPTGDWAYARVDCCLARLFVVFERGEVHSRPAADFLPELVRTTSLATAGPPARDGRILMAVECCIEAPPDSDPSGLYLVTRDLATAERLTTGAPTVPIGIGPDGSWVAGLRADPRDDAIQEPWSLVVTTVPGGEERTLIPFGQLPIAEGGDVAADGTIAIATRLADQSRYPVDFGDLWIVNPADGTRRNVTEGRFPGFTAFSWAPADMVAAARR